MQVPPLVVVQVPSGHGVLSLTDRPVPPLSCGATTPSELALTGPPPTTVPPGRLAFGRCADTRAGRVRVGRRRGVGQRALRQEAPVARRQEVVEGFPHAALLWQDIVQVPTASAQDKETPGRPKLATAHGYARTCPQAGHRLLAGVQSQA